MPNKAECILKRKKELTIQNLYALRSLIKGGGLKFFFIFRAPSFFIRHPPYKYFQIFSREKKFPSPHCFFQPLPWPLHRKQSSPPPLKDNFIGGWRLGGLVGGAGKSPLGQIWLLFGSSCPRLFLSSTGCV